MLPWKSWIYGRLEGRQSNSYWPGNRVSFMARLIITAFILIITLGLQPVDAQQAVTFKNFSAFKDLVPGIDFYASSRKEITPFEKPFAEARKKLETLLGNNLPKGAVFICSKLVQKDSVYEPKVLKAGYGWVLIALTSEASAEEMMARIKSEIGNSIPAEFLNRMRNQPPEGMTGMMEKRMVGQNVQLMAYAVIQSKMGKDLVYRSSRLDDMSRSPLPDWLDIGIAAYAADANSNLGYLQQHLDEAFPIEDVLGMSRPFVASSSSQGGSGGGGGMMMGGGGQSPFGGMGGGQGMPTGNGGGPSGSQGFPGGFGGGQRGGSQQRTMSKDQQDRTLFDAQSSTFFAYLIEKIGIQKVKELISLAQNGKESREYVTRSEVLGDDFGKIETDWGQWVKAQKVPPSGPGFSPGMNAKGPF
jgi:hypothetical protein